MLRKQPCVAHRLRRDRAMKQRGISKRRISRRLAEAVRPPRADETATNFYPFLVHPVPQSRPEILAIASHLARRVAAALGKPIPDFSENAATFLASRPGMINDLASRVARAVASNDGSLITSADLADRAERGRRAATRRS